jgi:hypothetical protein
MDISDGYLPVQVVHAVTAQGYIINTGVLT